MNANELTTLARSIMDEYGLHDWTLVLGTAKRVYGSCNYRTRTIKISKELAAINPASETINTIKHEVAHSLAGPGTGHGPIWKRIAREIGATPERCHEADTPDSRWLLVCSTCNYTLKRFRKTSKVYACAGCCNTHNGGKFSPDYALQWVANPAFIG